VPRSLPSSAAAALAAALLLPVVAVSGQETERHLLTGNRIEIWNLAGATTIEATTGNDVVVEVTRGGSDRRDLRVRAEGGELAVLYPDRTIVYRLNRSGNYSTRLFVDRQGRFNDESGSFPVRIRSSGPGLDAHANLRILVPRGKRVEVNIAAGTIEATNTEGEFSLRTRFSPIHVTTHKGPLTAQTGSGSLRVSRVEGDANLSTGSGTIDLQDMRGSSLRASTGSGRIEGREVTTERFVGNTGSGSIRIDASTANDIRMNTGSGSVRIALRNTPKDLSARAGSGSVEITLPPTTNVEVDISTGSGGITSDFPVTMESFRRRELRGRIGTGADGYLRVSTGSGSVRLIRR
jgi:hypothetical protein